MKAHTILIFMVTVHTLAYGAGEAGFIDDKENDNRHKQFVQEFNSQAGSKIEGSASATNSTQTSDLQSSGGILNGFFQAFRTIPLIGFVAGFLASPYSILIGSNLPELFKMLIGGIMSVSSVTAMIQLWRGA